MWSKFKRTIFAAAAALGLAGCTPASSLTLDQLTDNIDVSALTGTTFAFVENLSPLKITRISCGSYTIAGAGDDSGYHNPPTIAAGGGAVINFAYARRHCSNSIHVTFHNGTSVDALGDAGDISNSTRVVVGPPR